MKSLHLANARPFCRLKAPLGLSLLHFVSQTRTCRGAAPPSCYRKTVRSLKHPTGVFVAYANANFIKSSPPGISDPTNPPNRRFPYKRTKKLIHPIMTALEDGFILKIPPIPDKTPRSGYSCSRPQWFQCRNGRKHFHRHPYRSSGCSDPAHSSCNSQRTPDR